MSCVVRWWDVLFVEGMHFSSKNAHLLNFYLRSFHHNIYQTQRGQRSDRASIDEEQHQVITTKILWIEDFLQFILKTYACK